MDLEKLKQDIEAYKQSEQEASEIIAELKAENDKLREDYIKLSQQKDLDNARWQKRCTDLHIEDKAKADKYWLVLQEIKKIADALSCKHPEDCWENNPDWNGEVYGCDVADNWENPSELATCPSKLASAILQVITKAESEG